MPKKTFNTIEELESSIAGPVESKYKTPTDTYTNPTPEILESEGLTIKNPKRGGFAVEQPVGELFAPYGGTKKIDTRLEPSDLQNIPEARAEAQTGWQLIGNSLGQTGTELTLGLVEGVGHMFNGDIMKADAGQKDFDNAWTEFFRTAKENINENAFPIYLSEDAISGSFSQKLGDRTWWASNFPTVASTASIMLPGLGVAGVIGKAGKALKIGDKVLDITKSISAATVGRYVENNMEASQRFQESYAKYKETMSDQAARLKAGEDAANSWKLNSAMLAVDMLQYASILKPFRAFAEAGEALKRTTVGKTVNYLGQAAGEALEEGYQGIVSEEATKDTPFGDGFVKERLSEYLKDPELQSAMFWGAAGGATMQALAPVYRKIAGMVDKRAAVKANAATFNNKTDFDNFDDADFNSLLARNYKAGTLEKMPDTIDAFVNEYSQAEEFDDAQKSEIKERAEWFKTQIKNLQDIDTNLATQDKYKNNDLARKQAALTELDANTTLERVGQTQGVIDNYYSELPSNIADDVVVKKEVNKLEALKSLRSRAKNLAKDRSQAKEIKELLDAKIKEQSKLVDEAKNNYKEAKGKPYSDIKLPKEFLVKPSHADLEFNSLKHELLQKDMKEEDSATPEEVTQTEEALSAEQQAAEAKQMITALRESDEPGTIYKKVKDLQNEDLLKKANKELVSRSQKETVDTNANSIAPTYIQDRYKDAPASFVKDKNDLEQAIKNKLDTELSDIEKDMFSQALEQLETMVSTPAEFDAFRMNYIGDETWVNFFNDFISAKDMVSGLDPATQSLNKQEGSLGESLDGKEETPIIEDSSTPTPEKGEIINFEGEIHINNNQWRYTEPNSDKAPEINPMYSDVDQDTLNYINSSSFGIGTKVIARYSDEYGYNGKTNRDFTNISDVQIRLYDAETNRYIGPLHSLTANISGTLNSIKQAVKDAGEIEFTITKKYSGDILTIDTKKVPHNTIKNIIDAGGVHDLSLGFTASDEHGTIVEIPRTTKNINIPTNTTDGDIFAVLDTGGGYYMGYPLLTRRVIEGEHTGTNSLGYENNIIFNTLLTKIQSLSTANPAEIDNIENDIAAIVSLPLYYQVDKNNTYYIFNPRNLSPGVERELSSIPNVTIALKRGKSQGDPYDRIIKIPANLINSLEVKEYPEGTAENKLINFFGQLKLQVNSSWLNNSAYIDLISNRTKTNLANTPIVNTTFVMAPSEAIAIKTPVVKDENTEDLSDVSQEETQAEAATDENTNTTNDNLDDKVGEKESDTWDDLEDDDDDDYDPADFADAQPTTVKVKPINLEKELKWLQSKIPNVKVSVLEDIASFQKGLDYTVYARFKDGIIELAKNSRLGSGYHEAFHAVFNIYLSESERMAILEEARTLYGDLSNRDLEEELARDFQDSFELTSFEKFTGKIKNFFTKLFNWIKTGVWTRSEIEYLYNKINKGYYTNKQVPNSVYENLKQTVFTDRVPGMTPSVQRSRENTLLAQFSKSIDKYVARNKDKKNMTRMEILNQDFSSQGFKNGIDYFMNRAIKTLKKHAQVQKQQLGLSEDDKWLQDMRQFINHSVHFDSQGNLLYGEIGKGALAKLAKTEGIKIQMRKASDSTTVMLDDLFEITEENTELEGWQTEIIESSGKIGLSNEVRRMLSYIPVKDGNVKDDLGFKKYMDFNQVYATLKTKLSDYYYSGAMMNRLKELANSFPEYKGLVQHLEQNPLDKTKFFVDFAKSHADFKYVLQTKTGGMIVLSSNANTSMNNVIQQWETSFYNKGLINNKGEVELSENIIKRLKEITSSGGNKTIALPIFREVLGIDISEEAESRLSNADLRYIAGDLLNKTNVFSYTKNSRIKKLAAIESEYRGEQLESSFRNIQNKNVYSHIVPNFTAKQVTAIKRNPTKFLKFYSQDAFYANSPLINDIVRNSEDRNELEYVIIDGIKFNNKGIGSSYADFSDKEFLATSINMWFNNDSEFGYFQGPILSDAPNGLFMKLRKYKLSDELNDPTNVLRKLYEVAVQEYERIKAWKVNKTDDKFFSKNGGNFMFLNFLTEKDMEKSPEEVMKIIDSNLNTKFTDEFLPHVKNSDLLNTTDNFGLDVKMLGKNKKLDEAGLTPEQKQIINARLKSYYYNSVYSTSQIATLTTGDPTYYKSVTDFYKRAKEIWSPTLMMDTDASFVDKQEGTINVRTKYNTLYIKDDYVTSQIARDMEKMYQVTGDIFYASMAAQYGLSNDGKGDFYKVDKYTFPTSKVNTADAQTFITPQRYREIAIGFGRWTDSKQALLKKLESGEVLNPDDYKSEFQPYKPFYFGHLKDAKSGKIIPVQNKNSEFLITAQLAFKTKDGEIVKPTDNNFDNYVSPTLAKIYNTMLENDIDSVSFESVVKVGLSKAVSLEDAANGNFDTEAIHKLNNKNFGLQQEVPQHYLDNKSLFGTQIRKHIIANLNLDDIYVVDGNEITGKQLVKLYQDLIIENIKESYSDLVEDITINGKLDNEKLSRILQEEIISRELGEDLLEAVKLDSNGNFNLELSNPLHFDRNEKLLNSLFKNRITKQKIKGGPFVQVSGVFFSDDLHIKTDIETGRVIEAECYLPWTSKKYFEPLLDENGLIDVSKIEDQDILKMIGYRIPTEDKYSMLPLKVKGFLPSGSGGGIMLPVEITTLAGSDFDVDKLYVMMPEFEQVKVNGQKVIRKVRFNKNVSFGEYLDRKVAKESSKVYKKYKPLLDELSNRIDRSWKNQSTRLEKLFEQKKLDDNLASELIDEKNATHGYITVLKHDLRKKERILKLVNEAEESGKESLAFITYNKFYPSATNFDQLKQALETDVANTTNKLDEATTTLTQVNEKLSTISETKVRKADLDQRVTRRKKQQEKLLNEKAAIYDLIENEISEIKKSSAFTENDFKKLNVFRKNSKQARNNLILDTMFGVLTNKNTFKQFIKPGGFADFQRNSNLVYLLSNKQGSYQELSKLSNDELQTIVEEYSDKQEGIDLTSPLSLAKMFTRNMTGKKLVGIFANHNAHHSIIQHTNLRLSPKSGIKFNGKTYTQLNKITNDSGDLISNVLAQYLAAVVDNAKDPNAFKSNINTYTADILAFMTRLGIPMEDTLLFLKQPAITKLVQRYFLYGADFTAEKKAIKASSDAFGFKTVPTAYDLSAENITKEELLKELQNPTKEGQMKVFQQFILYKDKANTLADLIRAMRADTSGMGPNMANNELTIRLQRNLKSNESFGGILEIFQGEVYPMFAAFNDYGLLLPHNLLRPVFPLSNTSESSAVNAIKVTLQDAVGKKQLSLKDISSLNSALLTYIGSGIESFDMSKKQYFVKEFPKKYQEFLDSHPEVKEQYLITEYISFVQNDKFPYPRIEFVNSGGIDQYLREDLKDSWYNMLEDENEEVRNIARDLIYYTFFKEGYVFGPKTFSHMNPTRFFLNPSMDGFAMNESWTNLLQSANLGLRVADVNNFVDQFIENNWKNSQYVTQVEPGEVTMLEEGNKLQGVRVTLKQNPALYNPTTEEFVRYISVKYKNGSGEDVILLKQQESTVFSAIYTPVSKKGEGSFLNEYDKNAVNMPSMLDSNNPPSNLVAPYRSEEIRDQLRNVSDEEIAEDAEKTLSLSEQAEIEALQIADTEIREKLLAGYDTEYLDKMIDLQISKEDIEAMSAKEIQELHDKICK